MKWLKRFRCKFFYTSKEVRLMASQHARQIHQVYETNCRLRTQLRNIFEETGSLKAGDAALYNSTLTSIRALELGDYEL